MKIADFISKSIQEYPSLYKDVDYEKSKLKVLDHVFFTNGNGMEMAETLNQEQGGYVVHPVSKKSKDDEWVRVTDKPYGTEKYRAIPKNYFNSSVYYVYGNEHPVEVIYRKSPHGDKVLFRYTKKSGREYEKPSLYEAKSDGPFIPYPFSKNYSIACNVYYENIFLQDDWMQELIFLCEKTLEYFNDENQYQNDSNYPKSSGFNWENSHFEATKNTEGVAGVKRLRRLWGYEPKDTIPDPAEWKAHKEKQWVIFREKQISFLNKFLKKYRK